MNIRPIKTETDYDAILERIDVLMDLNPEIDSPDGDELEVLISKSFSGKNNK